MVILSAWNGYTWQYQSSTNTNATPALKTDKRGEIHVKFMSSKMRYLLASLGPRTVCRGLVEEGKGLLDWFAAYEVMARDVILCDIEDILRVIGFSIKMAGER